MKEIMIQLKDEQAKALESGQAKLALVPIEQADAVTGGGISDTIHIFGIIPSSTGLGETLIR